MTPKSSFEINWPLDIFLSLFTCFIGGFPAFLAFSSRAFEVEVCLIEGGAMFKRFLKDAKRSSADGILKVTHNFLNFSNICYKILKWMHNFLNFPCIRSLLNRAKRSSADGILKLMHNRGISCGWAIAHPDFGKLEGTAGQRRRAALLLAHPDFGSYLRPCIISNAQKQGTTD